MSYTRQQIASACQSYGSQVGPLPANIDGAQLLWALSGNESSFGANCTPRHEPAYDVGGFIYEAHTLDAERLRTLVEQFGSLAASSFGPWQIMFVNCPPNYIPEDMNNLDKAAVATLLFLNRQLNRFRPSTLELIGAIWNGGNPGALQRPEVQVYADRLERNYAVPLPEAA